MKIIVIPNAPRMTARHYLLSKTLVAMGHEIHYVQWQLPAFSLREALKYILGSFRQKNNRFEAFDVHSFRHIPYILPSLNRRFFQKQLRKLFKHIDADFIVSEGYLMQIEVPADLPFIYDLADDYAGWAKFYGSVFHKVAFRYYDVQGAMDRQCSSAMSVTVVSEQLRNYASKFNQHIQMLPNGIHATLVRQILLQNDSAPKDTSLVYASGFGKWSRVIEVLRTVTELKKQIPSIQLRLIGDGTEVENIRTYIRTNDASDYIEYVGFVSDQTTLFKRIHECSIGLNISDKNSWRDASFPMKVIDYSALGMKVVSTDLQEVRRLGLPNITLCNNQDGSLLDALAKSLSDNTSYAYVSDEVIKKYDWNNICQKLIDSARLGISRRTTR